MYWENPSTLLRRCTKLDSHTTRNSSTYYICSKCHQICDAGEQATYQTSDGFTRKDTSGCHHTLQHQQFTLQQPELPTNCTPPPLHSGRPQRFPVLHETSCHACNGLHRCSYNWHTITSCTTGRRSQKDAKTHWGSIPSIMLLPVSSEDTLHSYRYLCTPVLIADKQFLLLIDVLIQDCTQQPEIYEIFNLVTPNRNFSECYNIAITHYETKAVEISGQQFSTCQKANGQFCSIKLSFQPLADPPSCLRAIYAKNTVGIEKRCSLHIRNTNSAAIATPTAPNVWILTSAPTMVLMGIMIISPKEAPRFIKKQTLICILHLSPTYSATSQHFHLPPCYETDELTIKISFNAANLNVINISSPEFRIWQHLEEHWNGNQLHHLLNIPSVPINQLYKHMISSNGLITPFMSTDQPVVDTASTWTLFSHTGIYVMAIGSLIPAGLGMLYCYFFLCWPDRLVCQPLQSGSTWHTIVDYDVEAVPIYRWDGRMDSL